jgi:hypothetical protein
LNISLLELKTTLITPCSYSLKIEAIALSKFRLE